MRTMFQRIQEKQLRKWRIGHITGGSNYQQARVVTCFLQRGARLVLRSSHFMDSLWRRYLGQIVDKHGKCISSIEKQSVKKSSIYSELWLYVMGGRETAINRHLQGNNDVSNILWLYGLSSSSKVSIVKNSQTTVESTTVMHRSY